MIRIEVKNRYYEWLLETIGWKDGIWQGKSYRMLLRHLFNTEFWPSYPLDSNRAEDGMDLRYRYGYETRLEKEEIRMYLDYRPCSMLEMMVSLCKKCEESLMYRPEDGDRTGNWFFDMVCSLGLADMNDENFREHTVDHILEQFMDHRYKANGRGGLYTIQHSGIDMRRLQIWDQMNEYLNEILDERGE